MIAIFLTGLLACSLGTSYAAYQSPMDAIVKQKLWTFGALVRKAGLDTELSSATRVFTVFAPAEAAWKPVFAQLGLTRAQVLANSELVNALVQFHIVPDRSIRTSTLRELPGQAVPTMLTGQGVTVSRAPDAAGKPNAHDFFVSGYPADNKAQIIKQDLNGGESTIDVINKVLIPGNFGSLIPTFPSPSPTDAAAYEIVAPSIYDYVASQPTLSQLKALIDSTGMAATLKQTNSGYTLLAPHNTAFLAYSHTTKTKPTSSVLIAQLLLRGSVFTSQLKEGATFETYAGTSVTSHVTGTPATYKLTTANANARIVIPNLGTGLDAVQVVDVVLFN